METTGVGGGLMLAIAALLWMAYLVPTWFKRREYLSTERNAVRLQQTVRVLAETAELPDVVRAGMFPQRSTVQPPRAAVTAVASQAAPAPPIAAVPAASSAQPAAARNKTSRARRLRRTRAATSVVLLGSLALLGVQASLIATTGAVVGSWVVIAGGVALTTAALGMLGRLAQAGRVEVRAAAPVRRVVLSQPVQVEAVPATEWTPVPVPKPLYLSRPEPQRAVATDVISELRTAAIEADQALRAAQRAPEVVPIDRPAASRFASMGIVDAPETAGPDLDAVLRRRRAG